MTTVTLAQPILSVLSIVTPRRAMATPPRPRRRPPSHITTAWKIWRRQMAKARAIGTMVITKTTTSIAFDRPNSTTRPYGRRSYLLVRRTGPPAPFYWSMLLISTARLPAQAEKRGSLTVEPRLRHSQPCMRHPRRWGRPIASSSTSINHSTDLTPKLPSTFAPMVGVRPSNDRNLTELV